MADAKLARREDYPAPFCQACQKLQETIGYRFQDPMLLYQALTHSSFTNEKRSRLHFECNERLEFLGDSVLAIVVSQKLFGDLQDRPEGDLTRYRAFVVCEDALYTYAKAIDLWQYMLLGNGEAASDGRHQKSILADCYEALIAAVFLDGGMQPAQRFVLESVKDRLGSARDQVDYKSLLQQIVQSGKGESLRYVLISQRGPDHDKIFVSQALLSSNPIGTGEGRSKRESEQMAAKEALRLFGQEL